MTKIADDSADVGHGYLSGSLSLLARDLHRLFNRVLEERVGQYGLAFHTCRYLGFIAEKGSATPTELSEYLGVRQPTTLSALRILLSKRLVRRTPDASDGRKSQYRLTAKGAEIEGLVRSSAFEMEMHVAGQLNPEQLIQFRESVQVMLTFLDKTLSIDASPDEHDTD